jgi:hypothetical protein
MAVIVPEDCFLKMGEAIEVLAEDIKRLAVSSGPIPASPARARVALGIGQLFKDFGYLWNLYDAFAKENGLLDKEDIGAN